MTDSLVIQPGPLNVPTLESLIGSHEIHDEGSEDAVWRLRVLRALMSNDVGSDHFGSCKTLEEFLSLKNKIEQNHN